MKDAIEKRYSSVMYPIGEKQYTYNEILADFNTYYAIKIILGNFDVKKIN